VFSRTLAALTALVFLAFAGAATPATAPVVPHRIVSLSPTATEDLFGIGAGKQVVAVDDQSDYPKQAPKTTLSGFTPNAEAIIGYHPDLVVIQYDPNKLVAALAQAKIKVLVLPSAKSLADAYGQIQQLGKVTGHVAAAKALAAKLRSRLAALVKGAPRPATPLSAYVEISPDFYTATSKTFIGQILSLFGLRNIADPADDGSGFPKLSGEYILSADPNLIVLADIRCCGQSPSTVAARPGWSGIAAVKRNAIVRVDDSVASRWGPRFVDFARAIASALRYVTR
jgi:cobalamin transport system substrate-binding protein